MPPPAAAKCSSLPVFILAGLIAYGAAGLAGALAGSTALAAAAGLYSVCELSRVQSLDVFHARSPFI